MIGTYAVARLIHFTAVVLSGSLFTLRGQLMLRHSPLTNHPLLRHLSYVIDTLLLAAALTLAALLHQYPFVQAWLTAKVLLLVPYVVLGSLALRRGRTHRQRVACYVAALAVFLLIVSVAIAHHPPWMLRHLST